MKYPDVTLGRIEAVWNKLGGEQGVDRFLRNELVVSEPARAWREQEGVIYFSVTSDGTTGPQWIERLRKKGCRVGDHAQSVLCSSDFQPPTSGITYNIAVVKGKFFTDEKRSTSSIHTEAESRKWAKPNAEIACLIREKFSDKEIKSMGLAWIVTMHEPIKDFAGNPDLLGTDRDDDGSWLYAYCADPAFGWDHDYGFAFVVPQVS